MKLLKTFSELSISRLFIAAVFMTGMYYLLYYDDGERIETQITQVRSQLDVEKIKRVEIEKRMKKEEEMRGNLLQLARSLDIVKSKIPNEFNEIEISTIVNRASAASLVKISFLKRNSTQTIATPASNLPGQVTGAELIEEVSFDIEMVGPFNNIINFVELLSKEEKTIKIRNFTIDKSVSSGFEENNVRFKGEIVGFKQSANLRGSTTK